MEYMMIDHKLNRKKMRISKNPDIKLKLAKCVNVHCRNYDKLSETNCIHEMKKAMDCVYNIKSMYGRKE